MTSNIEVSRRDGLYSRDQLHQFRAAFASLSVIGPEWLLPPFPEWSAKKCAKREQPRKERPLTAFGKTQSLTKWAKEYRLNPRTLYTRLKLDWTIEKAISEPSRKKR